MPQRRWRLSVPSSLTFETLTTHFARHHPMASMCTYLAAYRVIGTLAWLMFLFGLDFSRQMAQTASNRLKINRNKPKVAKDSGISAPTSRGGLTSNVLSGLGSVAPRIVAMSFHRGCTLLLHLSSIICDSITWAKMRSSRADFRFPHSLLVPRRRYLLTLSHEPISTIYTIS